MFQLLASSGDGRMRENHCVIERRCYHFYPSFVSPRFSPLFYNSCIVGNYNQNYLSRPLVVRYTEFLSLPSPNSTTAHTKE